MGRINKLSKNEISNIFKKFGVEGGNIMADGVMEIKEIEVDKLKPHPKNESIYGQEEDVSDLVSLIKARGKIIDPLVITEDYVIISGHRRWRAAQSQELNYKTVPCKFVSYDNEEDELADLILFNADRKKTLEQKAREGMALLETLSSEAFLRRLAGLKQNQTDMDDSSTSDSEAVNERSEATDSDDSTVSEKGLTRDKIAKAIGLRSGKTFDRMKDVLEKVDALKKEDNADDSGLFVAVLNRSPSAAHDLLKVDLSSLSDEDRDKLKTGKVAPRAFVPKVEASKALKKGTNRQEKIKNGIKAINHEMRGLTKLASSIKKDEDILEISGFLNNTIATCNNLLSIIESSLKEKSE